MEGVQRRQVESYEEAEGPEGEHAVLMRFGICGSLPVPILWGGVEMRGKGLVDYHDQKMLSLRLDSRPEGPRHMTKSTSWLVAATEMAGIQDSRVRKAYRDFIPTRERLSNMIKGERRAINTPAILYPGRDNIVRVGRHNARVDEGYNEVVVLNREDLESQYGPWIVAMDCVANGEAFVIVRNNSAQPVRLAPGALDIAIRPAVCLPRVLSTKDKSNEGPGSGVHVMTTRTEHEGMLQVEEGRCSPHSFLT